MLLVRASREQPFRARDLAFTDAMEDHMGGAQWAVAIISGGKRQGDLLQCVKLKVLFAISIS